MLKRESCGDNHGFLVSAMFVPIRSSIKKSYIYGFNSSKIQYKNAKLTTHAEIQALNNLRYQCAKYRIRSVRADLHIFRKTRDGNMSGCAPCRYCTLQLTSSKVVSVRNLYYFDETGKLEKIKFKDWKILQNSLPKQHVSRNQRLFNCPDYQKNVK
jgi:tRNA(Arg) A34 adenosine deaminase TadA